MSNETQQTSAQRHQKQYSDAIDILKKFLKKSTASKNYKSGVRASIRKLQNEADRDFMGNIL